MTRQVPPSLADHPPISTQPLSAAWVSSLAIAALCAFPSGARGQALVTSEMDGTAATITHDTALRIVATSRLRGAFATPVCQGDMSLAPGEAARVLGAAAAARASGALVLDTGGLLGPSGIAAFAAEHEPAGLAIALADSGFHGVAVGPTDLSAPRSAVLDTWRALATRGVPVVASNLSCSHAARAVCETVTDADDDTVQITIHGVRVAWLSLLAPSVLPTLAADKAAGLRLAPLAETLALRVPEARRAGAGFVVVSLEHEGIDATAALALAAELAEDARPDLLLTAGGGSDLLFARPPTVTPALAAAAAGGALDVTVRSLATAEEPADLRARPLDASPSSSQAMATLLATIGPSYCTRWGHALAGGRLTRPVSGDDFLTFATRVVRERAHADVALLNASAFDPAFTPLRADALTESDVYLAALYDDPLVVADVSAAWLGDVAKKLGPATLVAAGLTQVDDGARVAGQPVGADLRYRVVTLSYLAEGGAALLPDGPTWTRIPGATLRSALLQHLSAPRPGDARDAVARPEDASEWQTRLVIDLAFGGTAIANPSDASGTPRYDAAQLTRDPTIGIGGSAEVTTTLDGTWVHWTTTGSLKYRLVWTVSDEAPQPYQESDDLIVLDTMATWKIDGARDPVWYMPRPSLGLYAESELTIPEGADAARSFRHLLLRPTLGLSFLLARPLTLRVSAGVEDELLSPDARFHPGAGAQLILSPFTLGDAKTRGITFDANVNYFVRDVLAFERRAQTLRAHVGATFAIASWLGLTLGYDLYLEKFDGIPVGLGLQAVASLRGIAATRTATW
jgi:2',3'-cyclic-nucleotide 2'-phosphodiesterase (5'-nucleotidase family)